MDAENVVLTSTFVTLGSTVGGHLAETSNFPSSRVIVGGFFAMLLCAIVAEVNGELGGALSVAIAGTAFVMYGLPAINSEYKKPKPAPVVGTANAGSKGTASGVTSDLAKGVTGKVTA